MCVRWQTQLGGLEGRQQGNGSIGGTTSDGRAQLGGGLIQQGRQSGHARPNLQRARMKNHQELSAHSANVIERASAYFGRGIHGVVLQVR